MARRSLSTLVRYLRQLTDSAGGNGASDAELLECYVRHRDEAAFELLLWRHGTLVFNVCRRILPREQDAEDAFQATFLAFVRKAASISRRGSIASWLYKVAFRVSLAAKAKARKIAVQETSGCDKQAVAAAADSMWQELRPILDEEVNRLPERLRRPFVLCYLEGKTNEEAARQLGCPTGTIFSRLARGREMLRRRLQHRGVSLTVATLTTVLWQRGAEAVPPALLMTNTVRIALLFAAGQSVDGPSAQAATLAEGVLRTMYVTKLKLAVVMLFVVIIAAGGVWTHDRTGAPQAEARAEDPPPKPAGGEKKDAKPVLVKVVKPKQGGLSLLVARPAEVVAAQQQNVVPLVSGTVKEVLVDIGDRVKKGQTLIVLDAPLLVKEVDETTAAVEMAKAQFEEAEAQTFMAKAGVDSAKADLLKTKAELSAAKLKMKSAEDLAALLERHYKSGQIPMERFVEAKQKVESARGQIQLAEPAIATAEADVQVKMGKLALARAAQKRAIANVNVSQATLGKARIHGEFTQLKAAFDGVVTRRTIDPGNYVQPSDSRLLRPLLTVQRIDMLRVVVHVFNYQAPLIKRGMPVEMLMPGVNGRDYKISRFSPSLDGSNRQMTVEIDVPNTDERLLPGMEGTVKLPLHQPAPDSLIVPSACVIEKIQGPGMKTFVYIVRDGEAYEQEVSVDVDDGKNAEITKGIQATDLVITNPNKLKNGTPVKAEQAP
jgi:RND family efflux transporter MFP subunit